MSSPSPLFWPLDQLIRSYSHRDLSPVEVTTEALERIRIHDPVLGSYLTTTAELALEQARQAEVAYADGTASPLAGVPMSIKDLFDVEGTRTTYGSLAFQERVAPADSGAVRRLRLAGAVFLGKTNTAEFGQSATTENLLGPPARNPWDPERTAGGSSGGAAASVGAGLALAALGSDGGGSTRIPAAFCGLFGLKPSSGLCPDEGGFTGMKEFAVPGPITRRVSDARPLLAALAGRSYQRSPAPRGLRVCWCPTLEGRPVDPGLAAAVEAAVGIMGRTGQRVVRAEAPVEGWIDIFRVLVLAEEWAKRRRLLEPGQPAITDYEERTLLAGSRITEAEVAAASAALAAYRERFRGFLRDWDLMVTPSTAVPAFPVGQRPELIAGIPVSWLWGAFPFTPAFNVAGVAAATVPCGLVEGLPVGLQMVAAPGREDLLLDVCEEIEEALRFDPAALAETWL